MPLYESIDLHPTTNLPSVITATTFDVICIGSGWAANTIGSKISKHSLTALIVEAELFGGDCPFWACVPSKVLLRPGEALHEVNAVPGAREMLSGSGHPHVEATLRRRDIWTQEWKDDRTIIPFYESFGMSLVRGHARIIGDKQVEVEQSNGDKIVYTAERAVVLCTGSEPVIPDIRGLSSVSPWTTREATSTSTIPSTLAILGSGAVGCEMATAFASLGSKVHLLGSSTEILPRFDDEAGATVRRGLERRGITVHCSVTVVEVSREADNLVRLTLSNGTSVPVAQILIATGRKCRTHDLGLEKYGINTDGSPLEVDDSLRVLAVPGGWLYAAGDVNGRMPMSHGAKYHGWVISNWILSQERCGIPWSSTQATADHHAVPQVVFTLPEIASVGLTKQAAIAKQCKFREITAPIKTEGAQLRADEYEDGWAQWIADADSGKLLGATFVGVNAAELLHASTVAIVSEITLDRLAHAIPSFPTMSEVYLNLLEAADVR